MKILATADLHNRQDWYQWLLRAGPNYDALIVAGDMFDMFEPLPPQVEGLRDWVAKAKAAGINLLICGGNHDFDSVPIPLPDISSASSPSISAFVQRAYLSEHWMDPLVDEGALVVGGKVQVLPELGGLIVSSLLHGRLRMDQNLALMEEASRLRRAAPRSPWIVLSHEPPVGMLGDENFGNPVLSEWIEEFQPRMVFCGHDHRSPLTNNTCSEQIGLSRVFNPGHDAKARQPNCVEVDSDTMKHRWLR